MKRIMDIILSKDVYKHTNIFVKEMNNFFKKYETVLKSYEANNSLENITLSEKLSQEELNKVYLIKKRLVKTINPLLESIKNYSEVIDNVDSKLNPIRKNIETLCKIYNFESKYYLP